MYVVAPEICYTNADSDTVSYKIQKHGIVGPAWKTPFIGPFLDSMRPDFRKYQAKWASGDLSCVSVFHKYVAFFDNL